MIKTILTSLFVLLLIPLLYSTNAKIWNRVELIVNHPIHYDNPFKDVNLLIKVTRPDGSQLELSGYFDYPDVWKFRIMPDMIGKWKYIAWFTDEPDKKISGSFRCVTSDVPGLIAMKPIRYGLGLKEGSISSSEVFMWVIVFLPTTGLIRNENSFWTGWLKTSTIPFQWPVIY